MFGGFTEVVPQVGCVSQAVAFRKKCIEVMVVSFFESILR